MAGDRILVVDDEPGVRSALAAILNDEGFHVECVASGEEGLEALERATFDALMLDVWLPGMDGLETLERIRERHADTEVVMISGHATIETAVRATKLGAFDFVEKPLSLEKTLLVLRNALRQRKLEQINRRLLEQLHRDTEIVGRSAAVRRLRAQVEVAAGSDAPALICGRPGSGRESVARRIHGTGSRSEQAFVEVPCAALEGAAATLALFGDGDQPGRIRLATGGSLFLEDADHLPGATQQRLASVVHDQARQAAEVRLLASVGPDADGLQPELKERLNVIHIEVPSLRERREDIPMLAERLMRDLAREYGREPRRLAPEALDALQAYDWPGETRELGNLMERLLLFASTEVVGLEDLPEELGGSRGPAVDLYRLFDSLDDGLRSFERYYIQRVLAESGGDQATAAEKLRLPEEELRRRLKRL